jgi:hypothetical protein
VQRGRLIAITLVVVHRPESAGVGAEVARPVVIEIQVGIELLAGEEIVVRRRTGRVQQIAEGVVIVGVGDGASGVGQRAHRTVPVKDVLPPLFNQFFPGVGAGYDGLNADPHGITNFRGVVAMGYTNGTATDNAGHHLDESAVCPCGF